jgi:class 3 adenylate cyclase
MFRNRVILILIFFVFVTTNVTYGQKNDNIRDIERSLNKSEGSEKLSKLNILTKHYKSTGDKQKLYKYAKQGAILARDIYITNPSVALDDKITIVDALSMYGETLFNRGSYSDARQEFTLANTASTEMNFKRGIDLSEIYLVKIDSLDTQGLVKESFFQKTFKDKEFGEVISETTAGIGVSSELTIAQSKEKNGKTEEAIVHYEKAIDHLKKKGNSWEQVEEIELKITQLKGLENKEIEDTQVASQTEKIDIGPELGTSMEDLVAMPSEDIESIDADLIKEMALDFEKNENYEEYLEYYKMYLYLEQRLKDDSIKFLAEQEVREQEVVLLRQQNEIADLNIRAVQSENEQQAKVMEILTIAAVFVLLATLVILILYFSKKRQHKKLEVAYTDLDETRNNLEVAEKKISTLLKQQVSGEIAKELIKPSNQGKKRFVCVMFLDIRDFTPRAETMSPEELIEYQNRVFGFMIDTIEKYNGNINQIMGDGFMATFGAPKSYGNDCKNAYKAAREILVKFKEKNDSKEIPPTRVGIGLHAGNVVTGNVGTDIRKQYSVTGNTVIIASRVEQLNKEYKSQLIITEEVYEHIKKDAIMADDQMIEVSVKGRSKPVKIIKVV